MTFGTGSIHHRLDRAIENFNLENQKHRAHEQGTFDPRIAEIQARGNDQERQHHLLAKCRLLPPGVPKSLERIAKSTQKPRYSGRFVSIIHSSGGFPCQNQLFFLPYVVEPPPDPCVRSWGELRCV